MIEMRVRQVSHHTPSGSDVVVLEAEEADGSPMIALAVSRADALSLMHEIDQATTPRSAVYDLLVRVIGSAGNSVEKIQIRQASPAMAQASVRIEGPQGAVELTIEVAQAVSLSTRVGQTLTVAEDLVDAVTQAPEAPSPRSRLASANSAPANSAPEAPDVPEEFRRAFGA